MNADIYYVIDLDGRLAPTTREVSSEDMQDRQFATVLLVDPEQFRQNQAVLEAHPDMLNVWGMSAEDGELVLIDRRTGDLHHDKTLDGYKATSIAFEQGQFATLFFQEQALIAFGLSAGLEAEEERAEFGVTYTLPFRVADHETAHAALGGVFQNVQYNPDDPTEFTVSAGYVAGTKDSLGVLFGSLLAEGQRVSIIIQVVNMSDPTESTEKLYVVNHDGQVESTSLRDLGQLLLTSPWNPTASDLVEADKEIDRLHNRN